MSDLGETRPQTPEPARQSPNGSSQMADGHSDGGQAFFTSIGCMDGRVQAPITEYGKSKFQAQYPDTITEAGLVGILSNNPSLQLLESIKKKVLISVEKHHSKGIIVHGHQECAGNPIDDTMHKENVLAATKLISSMAPGIEVKPVFVVRSTGGWIVEEL